MLTQVGTSKGFENVDTKYGSGDDRINVECEGAISVESNSQYEGFPFKRQQGVVQGKDRMSGTLSYLRSEKNDGGFWI